MFAGRWCQPSEREGWWRLFAKDLRVSISPVIIFQTLSQHPPHSQFRRPYKNNNNILSPPRTGRGAKQQPNPSGGPKKPYPHIIPWHKFCSHISKHLPLSLLPSRKHTPPSPSSAAEKVRLLLLKQVNYLKHHPPTCIIITLGNKAQL